MVAFGTHTYGETDLRRHEFWLHCCSVHAGLVQKDLDRIADLHELGGRHCGPQHDVHGGHSRVVGELPHVEVMDAEHILASEQCSDFSGYLVYLVHLDDTGYSEVY